MEGNQRVVVTAFGGADRLEVVEEPRLPEPADGEVRVRVLATSAAFTDVMIREGKYPGVKDRPPFSPGYDMVGEVDSLGRGVSGLHRGQRVADLTVTGGYARYLCLPARRLTIVPDTLDPAEAVSLVLSYVTAYQLLYRVGRLRRGQQLLVHGAAGAVGTAMLQLGNLLGLGMYGTASPGKQELVAALGATPLDYRNEDWVEHIRRDWPDGLDAVFDSIGGANLARSRRVVRRGGTLVSFGFYDAALGRGGSIVGDYLKVKLWNLLPNGLSTSFYAIAAWRENHPDWFREDLATLLDMLARGEIRPVIARRMPLGDARLAHELVETAQVQGKIVLIP